MLPLTCTKSETIAEAVLRLDPSSTRSSYKEIGDRLYIKGLFDNGAMVNAICSFLYRKFAGVLGCLQPSTKVLHMANGSHVKSHGQWIGRVGLGGGTMHATFEVFPSGKGWSLLFGKPLLQDFEAVQDYKRDTMHIQHGNSWTTLSNQCGQIESSEEDSGGAETPPSRQVCCEYTDIFPFFLFYYL